MYLFDMEVRKNPAFAGNVKVLWFIHDAIMFLCRNRMVDRAQRLLKDCMESRAPQYIKDKFKVTVGYPVVSEGSQGPNWASMEEVG
jgi:DNA polymerase I-like protein with 3'-5' exonuclease and polymerase domains